MPPSSILFDHLLITKFNLRFADWKGFKNSDAFGSDEWMDHRFSLFDRFCFPSVRGQTNLNFTWLMLMDHSTSARHRQRMGRYAQAFPNLQLLHTTGADLFVDLEKYLGQRVQRDYLITTRIDNDDAYHREAMAVIQAGFRRQEFEFLNFSHGYQYFTGNQRLYLRDDFSSPFMSLVERRQDGFKTALFEQHNQVRGRWPLQQMDGGRFWLQVIHGRNVANNLPVGWSGWLRYYLTSVLRSPARLPQLVKAALHRDALLAGFNVAV